MIQRVCESCLCSAAATVVGWAWPVVSKGVCLHVRLCFCECVCEFLKAKSWHIAQRVGRGKNTTRIYCSLLSCRRQEAPLCVYICVCVCVCVHLCINAYVCGCWLCVQASALQVYVFSRDLLVGCTPSLNKHASFSITAFMMLCYNCTIKNGQCGRRKKENSENEQKTAKWQQEKKLASWRRCSRKAMSRFVRRMEVIQNEWQPLRLRRWYLGLLGQY